MYRMSGFAGSRALIASTLTLLLCFLGCSRPTPNVPTEGVSQSSQTPFQGQPGSEANPDLAGNAVPQEFNASHDLPFQESRTLPVGTLLTVSLQGPIVAGSGSKDSFEAVVDEPVIVDGNTLIPRGTKVSGRIESARISKERPDRGYVRLVLDSVRLDDLSVPIQTASLFARQFPQSPSRAGTIRVENGRRLTFRLTEAVFLSTQAAKASS